MPTYSTSTTPEFPRATVLGYPRIGRRRELKRALEAYWGSRISLDELETQAEDVRAAIEARLLASGLTADYAIADTFSLYDQVLDAAVTVGAVPERFGFAPGPLSVEDYFSLARGTASQPPLEMTKWFDSNYHYLVPTVSPESRFALRSDRLVRQFRSSLARGVAVRPALVGPVTLLALAKSEAGAPEDFRPLDLLDQLLPVYAELLSDLHQAGADWVQLDEPALVADGAYSSGELAEAFSRAYGVLTSIPGSDGADSRHGEAHRPHILLTAPYGGLGELERVVLGSSVDAVHLDLVRGELEIDSQELAQLRSGRTTVLGLVDGHNIWRNNLTDSAQRIDDLRAAGVDLAVSSSTSLFHVPHTLADEPELGEQLSSWLAFADEKAVEIALLARHLSSPGSIDQQIEADATIRTRRASAAGVHRVEVAQRISTLRDEDFARESAQERELAQEAELTLPLLPTTSIGSFPQTAEIRTARAKLVSGELTPEQYRSLMEDEIRRVIEFQEELGFDVLVHGEPERNDMVQYFAEHLDGFAVTRNGWVQSYGSRCTRPSIIFGDVSRPQAITVDYATFAQSLTQKPVKGMLTGPVTILAWSFPREDVPLSETANQIALALRDEISDLEAAGIAIVQVDEPALRELLPLRRRDQEAYLSWAVRAFRLATSGVRLSTQIHTHLCYSEFGEVISAIDGLEADVTSIEAARSAMEILRDVRDSNFNRGIGPGVYDIHSPRVPSQAEIEELLRSAVSNVDAKHIWVNPDCGLKTRAWPETQAALRNLVAASQTVRSELLVTTA